MTTVSAAHRSTWTASHRHVPTRNDRVCARAMRASAAARVLPHPSGMLADALMRQPTRFELSAWACRSPLHQMRKHGCACGGCGGAFEKGRERLLRVKRIDEDRLSLGRAEYRLELS